MLPRLTIGCLLLAELGVTGCDKQTAAPAQADAISPDEVAPDRAPAGKAGQVDRSHAGELAPSTAFETPSGDTVTLARFTGKPLLVNLWATWCAPCVAELPTLNALAAETDGRLTVLAVSQDIEPGKVSPFLEQKRLTYLKGYRDPGLGLSLAYGANLPTTIFYDVRGRELWRVAGDLDWMGATASKLLAER